jgi:CRP/FNR family transcriptional regulator, cyclic AMP receptor protein
MSNDPTIAQLRRAFQHEHAPDEFDAIYQRVLRARARLSRQPITVAAASHDGDAVAEAADIPQGKAVPVDSQRWPAGTFLGWLRPHEREAVLSLGHRRVYHAGTTLVREGETDTHVIVLLAGRVKVSMTDEDGRVIKLPTLCAGDVVGELGMLDGSPRSATATAAGEVVGLVLSAASFDVLLRLHPGVSRALLRTLSHHLRIANRRSQRAQRTVPERVASILLELARREGEPSPYGTVVRMTRGELAQYVGAAEVSVIKTLTAFNQRGLVRRDRGRVTILRPDLLNFVAEL